MQTKHAYHQVGAEAYYSGNSALAAAALRRATALSDSIHNRVDNLQNLAAAHGKNGEYGEQLDAHLKARRIAERHGLDSLRRISARSIGNIYAACHESERFCEGIEGGRSFLAKYQVEKPALLLLVCMLCLTGYLLFGKPE